MSTYVATINNPSNNATITAGVPFDLSGQARNVIEVGCPVSWVRVGLPGRAPVDVRVVMDDSWGGTWTLPGVILTSLGLHTITATAKVASRCVGTLAREASIVVDVKKAYQVVNGGLHLCAVTADGGIFLTTRQMDGSWTRFENIKAYLGDPGRIVAVSCSMRGGAIPGDPEFPPPELHISVVTTDGQIWNANRGNDGVTFRPFKSLPALAKGAFVTVSSAGGLPSATARVDDLNVYGSTNLGSVFYCHYSGSSGSWMPEWVEVFNPMKAPNPYSVVGLAGYRGMVTDDGRLLLQLYSAGPTTWNPIDATTRTSNNPGLFVAATTEGIPGIPPPPPSESNPQICGVVKNAPPSLPNLFHADWDTDGAKYAFNDVSTQTGRPGNYLRVCSADGRVNLRGQFQVGKHFCVVLDDGSLWWTFRASVGRVWEPFQNVLNTPAGNPGRIVAADGVAWYRPPI